MRTKLSKIAQAAGVLLAIAFTFGCSGGDDPAEGGVGKGNDILNYRTKRIGDQVWMAENLNYNVNGSRCYENKESNCDKYGRLYNWETAKTVCPAGWHLPSDAEWDALTDFVGGVHTSGTKLKATSGWNSNGNGTDEFGFSALPGGLGASDGGFLYVGGTGFWWSTTATTEANAPQAWFRDMRYNDPDVFRGYYGRTTLLSVRCVQD